MNNLLSFCHTFVFLYKLSFQVCIVLQALNLCWSNPSYIWLQSNCVEAGHGLSLKLPVLAGLALECSCYFLLFSSPFLSFLVCGWYIWLEWMGKLSPVLSQLGFVEAGWLYVKRWEALLSKRDRFGAAFSRALERCERLICNCCNSLLWEQTATTKCSWVKFTWNSMEKLVMEELASSSTFSLAGWTTSPLCVLLTFMKTPRLSQRLLQRLQKTSLRLKALWISSSSW